MNLTYQKKVILIIGSIFACGAFFVAKPTLASFSFSDNFDSYSTGAAITTASSSRYTIWSVYNSPTATTSQYVSSPKSAAFEAAGVTANFASSTNNVRIDFDFVFGEYATGSRAIFRLGNNTITNYNDYAFELTLSDIDYEAYIAAGHTGSMWQRVDPGMYHIWLRTGTTTYSFADVSYDLVRSTGYHFRFTYMPLSETLDIRYWPVTSPGLDEWLSIDLDDYYTVEKTFQSSFTKFLMYGGEAPIPAYMDNLVAYDGAATPEGVTIIDCDTEPLPEECIETGTPEIVIAWLQAVEPVHCKFGQTCYLKFYYPRSFIGYNGYLVADDNRDPSVPYDTSTSIADWLFRESDITKDQVQLPAYTSSTTLQYCIVVKNEESEIEDTLCDIDVEWNIYYPEDSVFGSLSECGCTEEEEAEEDWYSFKCSLKSAGCFLFHPSDDVRQEFLIAQWGTQQRFPYRQIIDTKNMVWDGSSSVDQLAAEDPEISLDEILPGASTTVMLWSSNTISSTTAYWGNIFVKINDFAEMIIWIFLFGYVIARLTGFEISGIFWPNRPTAEQPTYMGRVNMRDVTRGGRKQVVDLRKLPSDAVDLRHR